MHAPYGLWDSPITAEHIASVSSTISGFTATSDGASYWVESRPQNKGKNTLVKRDSSGKIEDITNEDFSVKTFVHEYGGGAFTVDGNKVYASNAIDSAIYELIPDKAPRRITIEDSAKVRFADLRVCSHGIIAIAEKKIEGAPTENFLALIDIKTGVFRPLAKGADFYASPSISPDGKKIAYLTWNHPHMPWDKTSLWVAEISTEGTLQKTCEIPTGPDESILQPEWSKEGHLYFISDRDKGFWNLHRIIENKITNICPMEAEVGEPLWVFGKSAYAFFGDEIYFTYNKEGSWHLASLNTKTLAWQRIPRPSVYMQYLTKSKNGIQYVESYADAPDAIVELGPHNNVRVLYEQAPSIAKEFISKKEHIAFPSVDSTAFGNFYPPKNPNYKGLDNELPPLLVMIHGGPTAQAKPMLQPKVQYFTSRGFAVLDVNYRGSTGYGRKYRDLLKFNWGIADVQDCINGALYLAKKGLVDPKKLCIRGGSSGGFTTLLALAHDSTFACGADYYGVTDLIALAKDTHKFELHYLDQLIGLYPQEKTRYLARSPIHQVDKLNKPLIIFQGEKDPIVPKNQSVMIFDALKKLRVKTELHLYPDEAHGFRLPANNIDSLKKETAFYQEVLYGNKSLHHSSRGQHAGKPTSQL